MTVDASAVARVVGIDEEFRDLRDGNVLYLPQRIAVFAQGASASVYSSDKFRATSAAQVCNKLGWGSPAGLIARALFPDNGDGVGTIPVTFYPLQDGYEAVPAAGTITPTGTQTKQASYRVRAGGVLSRAFVIAVDATIAAICDSIVAAVNSNLDMPIVATDDTTSVGVEAKWAGESGNGIVIELLGDIYGVNFAIVQPTGGLIDPDVDDALAQIGSVWESLGLNALDPDNEDVLDAFQTFGEGRWDALVRRPIIVFRGNAEADVTTATTVTATRTDDRVNVQLVAPGCVDLPCVIAARQLVRIARLANNNPPHDYGSQRATGLIPGDDVDQWDYTLRDLAVKAGSSTIEVRDGVVTISDVVTSWAPQGEAVPAFRFVVDIIKLMQVIFNIDLAFNNAEWDGAPLIPDAQPTTNPTAKKPKMAIAEVAAVLDSLGLAAIISDPAGAKKNTSAAISSGNPKRLQISTRVRLSGNTNIVDVDLQWGFFFGGA